jgi:hypothetical protein
MPAVRPFMRGLPLIMTIFIGVSSQNKSYTPVYFVPYSYQRDAKSTNLPEDTQTHAFVSFAQGEKQ